MREHSCAFSRPRPDSQASSSVKAPIRKTPDVKGLGVRWTYIFRTEFAPVYGKGFGVRMRFGKNVGGLGNQTKVLCRTGIRGADLVQPNRYERPSNYWGAD